VKGKKDWILVLVLAAAALLLLVYGLSSRHKPVTAPPFPTPVSESVGQAEASEGAGAPDGSGGGAEADAEAVPETAPASEPEAASEKTPSAGTYEEFVRESVAAYFAEYPAESYLIVNTNSSAYSPIPLTEDNSFRITQQDGSENVIHIGKNSFYMESSNCDNQNCVEQGEVTLENREKRLLFNMVICLPHNLSLELMTREEAEAWLTDMYAQEPSSDPPQE
jgi:hypothetical protein